MEGWTDEELIARYRAEAGSPNARSTLNQLFERHHARVAAWCLRMAGNADTAADLAQAIFLKAFQRIDSFRGDSKFTTWLYSIARNHCMDELRLKAARPQEVTDALLDQIPSSVVEDVSAALERKESEAVVRRLFAESLDETETMVMTLHYVHELPLHAVTQMLKLTNQSGAKAYVVSARRKLSRAFARWQTVGRPARGSVTGGERAE